MNKRIPEQTADGDAHHNKDDLLQPDFADGNKERADEGKEAYENNTGNGIEPCGGRRFHALLTEDLVDDRFDRVRVSLALIRGAGCRYGTLYPPSPKNRAVI